MEEKVWERPRIFLFPPTIPERNEELMFASTKGLNEKLVESQEALLDFTKTKMKPHASGDAAAGRRLAMAWAESTRQHMETQKDCLCSTEPHGSQTCMVIVEEAAAIFT